MIQELLDSIKGNCQLCQLMLEATTKTFKHRYGVITTDLGPFLGQVSIRLEDKDRWGLYVEIPIPNNAANLPFAAAELELFQTGLTAIVLDGSSGPCIRAEIDSSPVGERAMMLVRQWLRDCIDDRPECFRPRDAELPPRILDLGAPGTTQGPRIVDCLGRKGAYLTLSHVWGGKVREATKGANVERRRQEIELSSLPKTFRHAIYITRKLGFQYLWIDSLCIVQDCIRDCKANFLQISRIYSNSQLTIASLWSRDSHVGILFDRQSAFPFNLLKPVQIFQDTDVGNDSIWVRVSPIDWSYAMWGSPLNKRAWTLQERLLSPACLYFWTSHIIWECRSCTASEPQPTSVMNVDGPLKSVCRDMQRAGLLKHADGHLTAWYLLVEEYTSRELTFRSDR